MHGSGLAFHGFSVLRAVSPLDGRHTEDVTHQLNELGTSDLVRLLNWSTAFIKPSHIYNGDPRCETVHHVQLQIFRRTVQCGVV